MSHTPPVSLSQAVPLTSIRILAAGLVMVFHYASIADAAQGATLRALRWLIADGQTGVHIFFVLSGFLMASRYGNALLNKQLSWWQFMQRRLLRIYPAYAIALTLFCMLPEVVQRNQQYYDVGTLVILYTLTQAFLVDVMPLGLFVAWSLTAELTYYAITPMLLRLCTAQRWLWDRVSEVSVVLLGFVVSACTLAIFFALRQTELAFIGTLLGSTASPYTSLLARFPEYFAGLLAGLVYVRAKSTAPMPLSTPTTLWLVGAVLLIAAAHTLHQLGWGDWAIVARSFNAPILALGLISLTSTSRKATPPQPQHVLLQALSSKSMEYLGTISYSLYLLHASSALQYVWHWLRNIGWHALVPLPLMCIIAIVLSAAFYEWIEKPFLRIQRQPSESK
jgi:peptidoglycan/LPS O-acetylase OafA/YrhL